MSTPEISDAERRDYSTSTRIYSSFAKIEWVYLTVVAIYTIALSLYVGFNHGMYVLLVLLLTGLILLIGMKLIDKYEKEILEAVRSNN